MPLQALSVPVGTNQFFSAFSLSLLLPALNKEDGGNDEHKDDPFFDECTRFKMLTQCLFGDLNSKLDDLLLKELGAYTLASFPATFDRFINKKLRPKLVEYIQRNHAEYTRFFASDENFEEGMNAIHSGVKFFGPIEINALAGMTETPVRVYSDAQDRNQFEDCLPSKVSNPLIHLSKTGGVYQYLMDPMILSEALRQTLFPIVIMQPTELPEVVDIDLIKRAELRQKLHNVLVQIPLHLSALSPLAPRKPLIEDTFDYVNPTNRHGSLRFDSVRESQIVCSELSRVNLTTAYHLCLMSSSDGSIDKNRLYIDIGPQGFHYTVQDPESNIREGFIRFDELDHVFNEPVTLEQLQLCLPKIIKITSINGHTLVTPGDIGGPVEWFNSMGLSTLVGVGNGVVLGGLSSIGIVALISEFGLSAAIPFVGLPIAGLALVLTLGVATFGKHFAVKFEQALEAASIQLSESRFAEAAEGLDAEFNRWGITRAARSIYLTKQHYAMSHFFRAICAEKELDITMAYTQYQQASNDAACVSNASPTYFVSQLQLLKLLKTATAIQLPSGVVRETEIDNILMGFSQNQLYNNGLTEMYWKLHDKMVATATRFIEPRPLSEKDHKIVNLLLVSNGFFILRHFSRGFGAYMQVFGAFFQGCALAYLHDVGSIYLNETIKAILLKEMRHMNANVDDENPGLEKKDTKSLASKKFHQCADLLQVFKLKYKDLIRSQAAIRSSLALIETFILDFHMLSIDGAIIKEQHCYDIALKLNIPRGRTILLLTDTDALINFIAKLKRDFRLPYETLSEWLDALLARHSHVANLVSRETGDTMLHALANIPALKEDLSIRVREAALRLKDLCYARNFKHETPLFALKVVDPYQLKKIICPDVIIKIGEQLEKVDTFLAGVTEDPIKSKHFLLLEGPPGTGKSDTVLQHLLARGHVVITWQAGAPDDKYVGRLLTRVREFFEQAKVAAASNPTKWHFLFIDEINAVCAESEGPPDNGHHNRQEIVSEFQRQVDALKGIGNIVLIGTTNFPEIIALAMLERAHRILFSFPDIIAREKLLQHFFREKRIDPQHMTRMAKLTPGWTSRPLLSMATSIKSHDVDDAILRSAFIESALIVEKDFRKKFPHATLTLPKFKEPDSDDPLSSLLVLAEETREQFKRLAASLNNPGYYGKRLHALLYGPPGGGKTTAVREFAASCNFTFILIESGLSLSALASLFERAKNFSPAIIFIDEFDKIAYDGSPARELLQEQMDGFNENSIVVIGATNFPNRIAEPLLSRFPLKIEVPPFSSVQQGELISSMLKVELAKAPHLQLDEELQVELASSCPRLGKVSKGLSVRDISHQVAILFGDLRVSHSKNPALVLHMTLSQLLIKITHKPIQPTSSGSSFFAQSGLFPKPGDHLPLGSSSQPNL